MHNSLVHQYINKQLQKFTLDILVKDNAFYTRFIANGEAINTLFYEIYGNANDVEFQFNRLIETITNAYLQRSSSLKKKDEKKAKKDIWFLSNDIVGMSLYVDRFCGNLKNLPSKLYYLKELGVNFLHLMPLMESPVNESDGGYAVSNFRKIDSRFGTNEDFANAQQAMQKEEMYLMIDIVLNHTSHKHEWAEKAKAGDKYYQDFYYTFTDQNLVDRYNSAMPEIFPENSAGSFTYNEEMKKWVMTVFHDYQWDLNFSNANVFTAMLDTIFYYANLGVDILRIDAPAFIWKQLGTTCQNLPQAHTLLRLIKQCVQVATPGMALLGEAIVAPKEILKYFGTNEYTSKECDVAYAATNMALQWDALATGDTKIMLASQHDILQKPFGTTWISYTRCHDDIGLGYEDEKINSAGYNPYEHRKYIKEFYSGIHAYSTATGALFSVNPKTQDARISGTLASLCGLEKAIEHNNKKEIETAIAKLVLLQAHTMFIGGIPMLFYGDEVGYTNDYSYLKDDGKSYDNRWMHRPLIDWSKNDKYKIKNTVEQKVFTATHQMITIRKKLDVFADKNNIEYLTPHNNHILGFVRSTEDKKVFCIFNYSNEPQNLTWYAFKEKKMITNTLLNHCTKKKYTLGNDNEYLQVQPYEYMVLEVV
jgi:amylosucrase